MGIWALLVNFLFTRLIIKPAYIVEMFFFFKLATSWGGPTFLWCRNMATICNVAVMSQKGNLIVMSEQHHETFATTMSPCDHNATSQQRCKKVATATPQKSSCRDVAAMSQKVSCKPKKVAVMSRKTLPSRCHRKLSATFSQQQFLRCLYIQNLLTRNVQLAKWSC